MLAQEAINQNDGTAITTSGLEKLQDIMTEAKEKVRSRPRLTPTHKLYTTLRVLGIRFGITTILHCIIK